MRAARVDANQKEIVRAFRKLGAYVLIVSQLKNCCDCFVSYKGKTVAVEIKDGELAPSERRLTKGEQKFADEWKGEWRLVESLGDAIYLIRGMET